MSDVPPRLLREALRGALAPDPAAPCLDAETLAAWADGTLSARERTAAESHAAACARCQALLAAMVRATPPPAQRRWWRSPAFGWLVPIAVAATAVVVWINLPQSGSERFAASQRAPAAAAAAAPTESARFATAPPAAADRLASKDEKREADQSSPAAASAPRRGPATAGERRDGEALPARQFDKLAPADPGAAAKELREAQTPAQAAPPPSRADAPRADASAQSAAAEAAPQPDAAVPPAAPQANAAAPPAPAFRPPARAMLEAAASVRGQALAKASAVPLQIVSPNPSVRWRTVAAGSVDRSVDGGTTWQTQSTGVQAVLTSGAAPSPAICWLAGSAGTIVRSIDGRTWQRVAFPEAVDLASIRASDAANATVTTADGRAFVTSDGGTTWRPARLPQ